MNNPVRIVLISEGYPPTDGGVAISTQRVADNIARQGCLVTVFAIDYSRPVEAPEYAFSEIHSGIVVWRIGPFFRRSNSAANDDTLAVQRRRVFDRMQSLASEFRPAVILSFYAATAGLIATYVANSLRVPHVVGLRGNDVGRNIFSTNWLPALQFITSSCDWIVCVNRHLEQRLLTAFPMTASKATVIENGVELPAGFVQPSTRSYLGRVTKWAQSDIVAVFIGTPREKKGIRILLEAVAAARQHAPIRLLVVGPSLREEDMLHSGAAWDLLTAQESLHATGQLDRSTALPIAAEADIVVMPSVEDGMANGLLEGMRLGLCPIVSDIFGEVVTEGVSGWVVPRNDSKSLSRALVSAATDAERRSRFGSEAKRQVLSRHTAEAEAKQYVEIFRRLSAPTAN